MASQDDEKKWKQPIDFDCAYEQHISEDSCKKHEGRPLYRVLKRLCLVLFFPISIPLLIFQSTSLTKKQKKNLLWGILAAYLLIAAAWAGTKEITPEAVVPFAVAEQGAQISPAEKSNLEAWSKTWVSTFLSYPQDAVFLEDEWEFFCQDDVYEVRGRVHTLNLVGDFVEHVFVLHAVRDIATGNGRCLDMTIDGEVYAKWQ